MSEPLELPVLQPRAVDRRCSAYDEDCEQMLVERGIHAVVECFLGFPNCPVAGEGNIGITDGYCPLLHHTQ